MYTNKILFLLKFNLFYISHLKIKYNRINHKNLENQHELPLKNF